MQNIIQQPALYTAASTCLDRKICQITERVNCTSTHVTNWGRGYLDIAICRVTCPLLSIANTMVRCPLLSIANTMVRCLLLSIANTMVRRQFTLVRGNILAFQILLIVYPCSVFNLSILPL